MTLAQALSAYAALNAGLIAGFVGLVIVEAVARKLSARQRLSLNYGVCAALAFSVFASAWFACAVPFEPAVRILSGTEAVNGALSPQDASISWVIIDATGTRFDADSVGRVWIAAALALLAFGLGAMWRDLSTLQAIRRSSHCVRRIGRVSVWISDDVSAPFSYWRPGRAHVVLPSYLLEQPAHFRIVLAHELQHHRQRDTLWLHAFRALRLLCFMNPFAHLWARRVTRLQEFACDEAMTARPAFAADDYARCLLAVALRGAHDFRTPATAAGLIEIGDPKALIRRIEKMTQPKSNARTRSVRAAVAILVTTMTAAAFAAGGWIEDQTTAQEPGEAAPTRIASERAPGTSVRMPSVWPVSGGFVTSELGRLHGIDIEAQAGTAVLAFRDGVVETIDEAQDCGHRIRLRHSDVISSYCNVDGVQVAVGDTVRMGALLGRIAAAPEGKRPRLHFDLQTLGAPLDPLSALPRDAVDRAAWALPDSLRSRRRSPINGGDRC